MVAAAAAVAVPPVMEEEEEEEVGVWTDVHSPRCSRTNNRRRWATLSFNVLKKQQGPRFAAVAVAAVAVAAVAVASAAVAYS